ncbi:hypothetical protein [Bacillus mesophilum]|uniref:hypothetical protein n=1 Tax=Bacillus mesophilum TaxID=1071718 RepID=UPI001863A046|nr:hypothetical protein [Bacillus mesophilum]
MDITQKVIWAEIKLKVLESAMMLNYDYSNADVTEKLMEIVDLLDNTEPKGVNQVARSRISTTENSDGERNC